MAQTKQQVLKNCAGLIGNFLEHYDGALFGFLAPFMAPYIFPNAEPIEALIYTYALLPLGFLSRPLGAIVFGKMGDRVGRKKTLSITLIGMAAATGAIGFLPTEGKIAAILLALLRLLQNFFAAGEITGGSIFILEGMEKKKRSLWSSFFDAAGILGIFGASAATAIAIHYEISWRWLFLAGFLTGIIGASIRFWGTEETEKIETKPVLGILMQYKNEIAAIASVAGFSYVNYYFLTQFMNGFFPLVSSISMEEAIQINTLLLGCDFFLLPFFGWLAFKIGQEKLMMGALIASLCLTLPLLGMAKGATLGMSIGIRLCFMCIGVALAAPYHAWALERSPVNHRYLIGALGTTIGAKLIGSPAPALSLWLYQKSGWVWTAGLPVLAMAAFAALALLRPKKVPAYNNP